MRLFEIAEDLERLLNASIDPDTGEIAEGALAALDALEMARDEKALAVAAYIVGQEAEASAVEETAKRLRERAERHRRHADRLRSYLASYLPVGTKLSDARIKIGWRRSTAVQVLNEESIPARFWRIKREVDKAAIKTAWKENEAVPGAVREQRDHLVIG